MAGMNERATSVPGNRVIVREAAGERDFNAMRDLIVEYHDWLGLNLCFQGYEEEIRTLPGAYAAPGGAILLAEVDGELAGGVALKPLAEPALCEMKRLWVRSGYRSMGIGWRLASEVIDLARSKGYRAIVLDTFPRLAKAIEIYREMGFVERPPYYDNPLPDVVYMEKRL